MYSISIAARVTSDMSWKKESPYVQFTINFVEGTYKCLLHENKLKPNSKIEKGSLIQLDATVLDSNELLIAYYIIIIEEKRTSRQETNLRKIFNAAGEEIKIDK
ncbi:hypothetical protein [Carnobacterium maltaromaticum]|uniref:hypothetical protein n=1 Tax=Carnobacterium maltaromaticum TaxID=2751 RepID=UPI00295F1585|nr:hypothetical protein [Carnobacterium maltaromaticum]